MFIKDCSLLCSIQRPTRVSSVHPSPFIRPTTLLVLEKYRRGCDLQNVFFIIEEFTDTQKGEEVQHVVDIVMDTLRNPHEPRPEGELLIGKIIQEYVIHGATIDMGLRVFFQILASRN